MYQRRIKAFSISLLGLMLCACSTQQDPQAFTLPVIPVHAAEVKTKDVPLYLNSVGTLKPAIFVEIKPQTSGMLQAVHFTEGQFVKQGALLFSIDPQPYAIKLQESESMLAQNKASTESARKKKERYANLAQKDLIALQEWDEIQSQVVKMEALTEGDEARVAAAKLELQRCEIKAPVSGRIGKLSVHPGNLIYAGQAASLASIANIEALNIEFTLTENEYVQLSKEHRRGNYPIEVCSLCNTQEISKGALTFLDHSFDPQTGLILLKGKMVNAAHKFLPGQHVQVRIPIQTSQDAIVIPQKAVKINQLGPYVFVIKDDKTVEMRPVKIGEEVDDFITILDGLVPTEVVVTDGHLRLSPGLTVEILAESR